MSPDPQPTRWAPPSEAAEAPADRTGRAPLPYPGAGTWDRDREHPDPVPSRPARPMWRVIAGAVCLGIGAAALLRLVGLALMMLSLTRGHGGVSFQPHVAMLPVLVAGVLLPLGILLLRRR